MLTIITPTFNSAGSINANIKSVLKQSYKNYEHIIIDNVSSDDTVQIIKNAYDEAHYINKLKIISERDEGISDAFNKGVINANGEIITILNSDDYYYDDKVLERVVSALEDDDKLFTHGNIFFEDPLFGSNIRKPLLCSVTKAMPYNHPTMFFRKEVYTKNGFFDTNYKFAMDFEFICRLIKQFDDFYNKGIYLIGDPLVTMAAGGASWRSELASIDEGKRALKTYGFWNFDARKNYILRKVRTKIKSWLSVIKMENVVTQWRNRKWGN